MSDCWEHLELAGVPTGAIRPPARSIDPAALHRALEEIAPHVSAERREPLAAWLSAFHHHWPALFARVLGDLGEQLRRELNGAAMDTNRYLKLRRIAIENLSHLTIR